MSLTNDTRKQTNQTLQQVENTEAGNDFDIVADSKIFDESQTILNLQSQIGNSATRQLLQRSPYKSAPIRQAPSSVRVGPIIIQRDKRGRDDGDDGEGAIKTRKVAFQPQFQTIQVSRREINEIKRDGRFGINFSQNGDRRHELMFIDGAVVDELMEAAEWLVIKQGNDTTGFEAQVPNSTHVLFHTNDKSKLLKALVIKSLIFNEEAEPRSGKARAAPDEQEGAIRQPGIVEAGYDDPAKDIFYGIEEDANEFSVKNFQRATQKIKAKIIHTGPWRKGIRKPSQSDVMGGQNAKNYIVAYHPQLRQKRRVFHLESLRKNLGGRFEWLHLIGSSLGGPNTGNNLVAGSYDANTLMIALEHRAALWGARGYHGDFQPTPDNPITIEAEADVYPNTHIGKNISLEVSHGDTVVLSGDYNTEREVVVTKSEYEEAEQNVNEQVEQSRANV